MVSPHYCGEQIGSIAAASGFKSTTISSDCCRAFFAESVTSTFPGSKFAATNRANVLAVSVNGNSQASNTIRGAPFRTTLQSQAILQPAVFSRRAVRPERHSRRLQAQPGNRYKT